MLASTNRFVSLVVLCGVLGCKPKAIAHDAPAPPSPAAPSISSPSPSPSQALAFAPSGAPSTSACAADPPGGVEIPVRASSRDFRIAAAGDRALVTWLEPPGEAGGRRAMGRVYDGATHALVGVAQVFDETRFGDEVMSGAAPVASAPLAAIACVNEAPVGETSCWRVPADGGRRSEIFTARILNYGMQEPGIAALTAGADALIALPEGGAGDVALFSSRGAKKRARDFAASADTLPHADALAAAWVSPDEAAVVFRYRGALYGRVGGFDEKWRGKRTLLSEPGFAVGAPAITASAGGGATVLFATRQGAKDPWYLSRAVWRGDVVTKAKFDGSDQPTQAPALAAIGDGKCVYVAWVEGVGEATVTRAGTMCEGHVVPATVATLSPRGVEGGRAVLANGDKGAFVAWQEFPKGRPATLRVARLACK